MIAIDTQTLARFLVDDDSTQCADAADLVRKAIRDGQTLYVSDIVMCECVWVMTEAFGVPRAEVSDVLGRLLGARHFRFQTPVVVGRALTAFSACNDDFAVCLVREHEALAVSVAEAVAAGDEARRKARPSS